MAISEAWVLSAVTVGATELSIISGTTTLQANTTAGVYQLYVDAVTNMAKADEYRIRVYEKVKSSGTKRVLAEWTLLGVQTENFVSPSLILMNGFDFTLQKLAGTDRAFDASVRKVA